VFGQQIFRSGLWARRRYQRHDLLSARRPLVQVVTAVAGVALILVSLSVATLSLLTVWRVYAGGASSTPLAFAADVNDPMSHIRGIALDAIAEGSGIVAVLWLGFVGAAAYPR